METGLDRETLDLKRKIEMMLDLEGTSQDDFSQVVMQAYNKR